MGLDWDDEVPAAVHDQWIALFKEMKELDNVSFERCLTADKAMDPPMLCVFADAPQEAFGACAYLRQRKDDNTSSVKFIAAKSRVAPLKQLMIPRLELQAAVLTTSLAKSIQDETRIQFQDAKFFTDSSITLAWILDPESFTQFQAVCLVKSRGNPKQLGPTPMEAHFR